MDNNRPTTEIVLPDSQAKFNLYTYLRHGDSRKLLAKITDSVEVSTNSEDKKVKVGKIMGSVAVEQEDYALELMTKEAFDKDGKKVEDITEFIYNLTQRDGDILIKKVNELTNSSTLNEESKKK